MTLKRVAAGIVIHQGKILIAQRKRGKTCEYLWEFPGGKLEIGETMEQCLQRELLEELNLPISVDRYFMTSTYTYDFGTIELNAYFATCDSDDLSFHPDHEQARWVSLEEIQTYDFPPADKPILSALMQLKI
ncbi:MAG: (deoxy)nucleoside triphosphate pyrophosphohydrolase [Alphaproteobacteria bacterium]|nr:(deoxy)nucleoside triphosphate pyrophosphohydrolase [Alphaproteobacteria bacterium]